VSEAHRYFPLPARHKAASRLAWKIRHALDARGWSLGHLAVSRRWRLRSSSRVVQAYVSFFFDAPAPRFQGLVCSIVVEGKGGANERRSIVRELQSRLGNSYTESRRSGLMGGIRGDTRPSALLAELDRIAGAFGTDDRHSPPRSRVRKPLARLSVIGEAIVAHGTWSVETPQMRLPPQSHAYASIGPMPESTYGRPGLSSHLFVSDGKARAGIVELITRAEEHGYAERAGKAHRDVALMKLQPLSSRAALGEARLLEDAMRRLK
jgi:hypothetical protein